MIYVELHYIWVEKNLIIFGGEHKYKTKKENDKLRNVLLYTLNILNPKIPDPTAQGNYL